MRDRNEGMTNKPLLVGTKYGIALHSMAFLYDFKQNHTV
jgi:hypothetical protein